VGDGNVTVVDPQLNGYWLRMAVSGCPSLDGEYEGIAFMLDFSWVNGYDQLLLVGFDGPHFIWGEAAKH
jgi:hypothetical protein